mmetsp:Transcript_109848/g.267053  ORF Transcript_109848/g.267053 Transcript_109848/m.267053 type:complete len:277 (+) Transcript_109848:125-955(+)
MPSHARKGGRDRMLRARKKRRAIIYPGSSNRCHLPSGENEALGEGEQEQVADGMAPTCELAVEDKCRRHANEDANDLHEVPKVSQCNGRRVAEEATDSEEPALDRGASPCHHTVNAEAVEGAADQEVRPRARGRERHDGASYVDEGEVHLEKGVVLRGVQLLVVHSATRVVEHAEGVVHQQSCRDKPHANSCLRLPEGVEPQDGNGQHGQRVGHLLRGTHLRRRRRRRPRPRRRALALNGVTPAIQQALGSLARGGDVHHRPRRARLGRSGGPAAS